MTPPPDVSILIVNWNGQRVLENCLTSLSTPEPGVSTQVIVVDNHSSDGSEAILPLKFPRMQLIRNSENKGFATGNNQAAAAATGRYLFFLNNDTVVPCGTIRTLAKFLDEHPEVVGVGPKLIGSDGKPQRSGRNLITLRAILHQSVLPVKWTNIFAGQYRAYRNSFDADQAGYVPQLAAAALMVRREAFFAAGQWDHEFQFGVEDVDLCLRLGQLGKIYYLPQASITHLGRVSSHLNRGWVLQGYLCGYVRYFRKHHRSRWAALIYQIGITVDAPLRLATFAMRTLGSKLVGNRDSAEKNSAKAAAVWHFLTRGLVAFWKT